MPSLKDFLKTTKSDHQSYPATNQIHFCWHKYNEYVMCLKKSSGDEDGCKASRQLALSVCPDLEVEQWDEQRGNGNFLGVQYPPRAEEDHHH